MSDYQTEELRTTASLYLEYYGLEAELEELVAKRAEEKAGEGLTPATKEALEDVSQRLRAMRQYWREIRDFNRLVAEEESSGSNG